MYVYNLLLPKWDALGYTNRYQSIVCVVLTVNKIIKAIKLLLSPGFSNSETTTGTHSQLGCLSNPVVTPYKWGTIHSLVDLCVFHQPAWIWIYFITVTFNPESIIWNWKMHSTHMLKIKHMHLPKNAFNYIFIFWENKRRREDMHTFKDYHKKWGMLHNIKEEGSQRKLLLLVRMCFLCCHHSKQVHFTVIL